MAGSRFLVAARVVEREDAKALAEQDEPGEPALKPTLENVQKLVRTIIASRDKLQAYCDLSKIQDQIDEAEAENNTKAIDALFAKVDALEEQLGPEFKKVTEELGQLHPNSDEAQRFADEFRAIDKKCQ